MGSEKDEIDRRMKDTRDHMDENVTLEEREASRAKRYWRIAAIAIGVTAVAGAGYLVYRRARRSSRTEQLQRALADLLKSLPDSMRDVPHEVASRLKNVPLVTVAFNGNGESREAGKLRGFARKIAPTLVGTASSAVLERLTRAREREDQRGTA
jgi:hypothetical protein